MKKRLFITVTASVIAVVSLTLCFLYLDSQKDDIKIKEEVLFGDPSFAEDVELTMEIRYSNAPGRRWNITASGAGGILETEFKKEKTDENAFSPEMSLSTDFWIGENVDSSDTVPLPTALKKQMIADARKHAEKASNPENIEPLRLKDYTDYFPLEITAFIEADTYTPSKSINQAITDYFKLPVPADAVCNINAEKSADGSISNVDIYSHLYLDSLSLLNGSTGYLAFPGEIPYNEDKELRFSDGGIYCIPFGELSVMGMQPIVSDIKKIYSLEKDTALLQMELSTDKKHLLVLTEGKNEILLTVIETASNQVKQELSMDKPPAYKDDIHWLYDLFFCQKEDKVLLYFPKGMLHLMEKNQGNYQLLQTEYFEETEDPFTRFVGRAIMDFDWDGKTLAVGFMDDYNCLTMLRCFDKETLRFVKTCKPKYMVSDNCGVFRGADADPIQVTIAKERD